MASTPYYVRAHSYPYWNDFYSRQPPLLPHPYTIPKPRTYEQLLGDGIHVSYETVQTIQRLLPKILSHQKDQQLIWLHSEKDLIFILRETPFFVFKIFNAPNTENHYKALVKAKIICILCNLCFLKIPCTKLIQVNNVPIMVQQRIHGTPMNTLQLYKLPGLEKALQQLVKLIAITRLSEVQLFHVVDNDPSCSRNRCIAILKLGEMQGAGVGIVGTRDRPGLIGLMQRTSQIEAIVKEARWHNIPCENPTLEEAQAARIEELKAAELQRFYAKRGILENERKPIGKVNMKKLDLNLKKVSYRWKNVKQLWLNRRVQVIGDLRGMEQITLGQGVKEVVRMINQTIRKADNNLPLHEKRRMVLPVPHVHPPNRLDKSAKWFPRILNALVKAHYLFAVVQEADGRYRVQA